jgi:hypothetical protein
LVRTFTFVIALAALVFTGAGTAAHAAGCSKAAITQAADDTATARQILLDIPVGDGLQPKASPRAKRAMKRMKAGLVQLVGAYMACSPPGTMPDTIIRDLNALAQRITPPKSDESHYGYAIDIGARTSTSNPGVMLISLSSSGLDDSLMFAFTAEQSRWHEAFLWQGRFFDLGGGDAGALDYEISPPDDAGRWYLLVDSVFLGGEGFWTSIRYIVLRPQSGTLDPRIVYDDSEPIYWGNEDFGKLTAAKDWFDVRFHAFSIDVFVHSRLWVRHFNIHGDKVTRLQPVAESPRDFTDEWVISPWQEAADWTAPAMRDSLRRLHDHLNHWNRSSFQFESIRNCAGRDDWTQIEVTSDEAGPSYFFGVAGKQPFQLISASRKPDPLCQGDDQMQH